MAMNLNDLHTFAIVAKHESVTAAAHALGIPKSTVSRRLKRLEEDLKTELFSRSPKQIVLTQDGAAFYKRIAGSLDDLHAAQRAVMDNKVEPEGLLRITTTEGYGQTPAVLSCLSSFMQRYPKVNVDLMLTSRVTNMVEEQIDVGFRLYTGRLPGDANTMSRFLHRIESGIYVSPSYLHRSRKEASLETLSQLDFVAFTGVDFAEKPWLFNGAAYAGQLPFAAPKMSVNNTAALVHCALMGLGICILDKGSAAPYVATGELVRILPAFEQQVAKASIVWMASKHLSIKVRAFINHAVDILGQTS